MRIRDLPSIVCLALLLLTACAAPGAPPSAGPGPAGSAEGGPIRVGFGAPEFSRPRYQPLIDAFNAEHDDIQVQFVPIEPGFGGGQSGAERLRDVASRADTLSSLLLSDTELSSGVLADLRPLAEADAAFGPDDFHPGALAGEPDGGLYLLPRSLSVQLLSYNRDMWGAAGLADPAPGWGWDELLAAAEQLADPDARPEPVAGIDDGRDGLVILQGLLAEAGVGLGPGPDGRVDLDRPEVAAAIERVAGLIERGVIYQRPQGGGAVSFEELGAHIREGRTGMWIGDALMLGGPAGGAGPGFAIGSAALPALPRSALVSRSGYVMSAGSAHPEAAWRWLSYLSRRSLADAGPGLLIIGLGVEVPARASLAEQSGFWQGLEAAKAEALRAALGGMGRSAAPAHPAAIGNLMAALSAVRAGDPADLALREAQANLDGQLAEAAAAQPAAPPFVSLPDPAPTAAAGAQTIRFGAFAALGELRALADRFNAEQDQVFVELEPPSLDGAFSLASLAERYDCLAWPTTPTAEDWAALADLQPLLDADASLDQADYPAGLLAPLRDGSRLYGLPHAVDLRALRYNRDLFDAAGLAYPGADWDLADLLDAAARLTDAGAAPPTYGYGIEGLGAQDLRGFLGWRGAALADLSGAPLLDAPELRAALGEYLDLLRSYSPQTAIDGYSGSGFAGGSGALIAQGQVGMWFSYGMAGGVLISFGGAGAPEPEVALAPPPGAAGGLRASDIAASSLLITAASPAPAACWEWLKFLSGQPVGLGESFPARSSLATSPEFLAQARPGAAELYAAYAPALAAPAPGEARPEFDLYWLYRAADRALQGADLEGELAAAQNLSAQHYSCVAGGGDFGECARAVDPTYDGMGVRP